MWLTVQRGKAERRGVSASIGTLRITRSYIKTVYASRISCDLAPRALSPRDQGCGATPPRLVDLCTELVQALARWRSSFHSAGLSAAQRSDSMAYCRVFSTGSLAPRESERPSPRLIRNLSSPYRTPGMSRHIRAVRSYTAFLRLRSDAIPREGFSPFSRVRR